MNGKIIVVTGAMGALGRGVVQAALGRGARVVAVDFSAPAPAASTNLLHLGHVDLSDATQAVTAINAGATHFGALDALVNIAGGFVYETVTDGDVQSWQRMYQLNAVTTLNASRAAIPHLIKSSSARIVNVGAMGALQAGVGMGAYAASKSAVHRLTEALAAELKGKVNVNAVLPSTIDTPANRASMPSADFAKWVTPAELAHVILFLVSDEASAVTGALLPVAGRV
jgi:NAD(P)-dependent dehydrogenase (short-subunit alcohol dehydrogenase family)